MVLRERQKEPLFQVGFRIRLRFLEQSKVIADYPWMEKSLSTLIGGNDVAHNGGLVADGSLLSNPFLPNGIQLYVEKVFKAVYKVALADLQNMPILMVETINGEITIKCLQKFQPTRRI